MSVVLGIALICIALLFWPIDTTKDAKKQQTDIHFKIGEIGTQVADESWQPIVQGLVAYYKFDEGSGTSATNNRGGSSGTLVNGIAYVAGKSGYAVYSDGGQYVQLPTVSNARSIALWANIQNKTEAFLLDAREGLASGYVCQTACGVGTDGIGTGWSKLYIDGSQVTKGWSSIPTGRWVHIYLEAASNFNDNVYLMARYTGSSNLNGTIDEVMIFNRALSASEIRLLYENPGYPQ